MEEKTRLFNYLYFKPQTLNGKSIPGKFETLKVRFLYASLEQIPMGRVHLFNYAPKKYTRVLCKKNGLPNKGLDKVDCPMCKTEKYGTPSSKYYAFVSDLNDEGNLKLLEFNWSLGKQISEIAEIKGKPLHDLTFTLAKRGQGKDTTYTPIFEEASTFSVSEYFGLLGLDDYPLIVGKVEDKAPIMDLSLEKMENFIAGQFPWATNEDGTPSARSYTVLGTTVTLRNEQNKAFEGKEKEQVNDLDEEVLRKTFEEDLAELEETIEVEDTPSDSFF